MALTFTVFELHETNFSRVMTLTIITPYIHSVGIQGRSSLQGNIRYISLAVPLILRATIVQYVIYKPWLGGVYAEYTTRGRGQRKFAAEINPERSEGFIEAANFR